MYNNTNNDNTNSNHNTYNNNNTNDIFVHLWEAARDRVEEAEVAWLARVITIITITVY